MRMQLVWLATLIAAALLVASGCRSAGPGDDDQPELGAGLRYSTYGPQYNPGPDYWADVAQQIASRFPGATPQVIWIVGQLNGQGTYLTFPIKETEQYILASPIDDNEAVFDLFDELGVQVWLQVEPGKAPVEKLIHVMLEQYKHHPCVIGVGVDVEWYKSHERPEGQAVTDAEAEAWLAAARSHGAHYRLFLKHWLIEKMPPTARDGILFVDDSQQFPSLDAMVDEFATWGEAFAPAPVGFQFGYRTDQHWWQELDDPTKDIGDRILATTPNTEALYWVDFTVLNIFPP